MVARVFIDGEAGTTGLQIRERLAERRDIELLSISQERRKDLSARAELLNAADVAILCLPDEAAKESVSLITNDTTAVIDASTAYRVAEGWTYGFAEMDKSQSAAIAASKRVSNPGCWPQGVIAALRPLIAGGLVPADFPVAVNGISGYSGGGKSMIEDYEAKGDAANVFLPYGLAFNHKHLPEMQCYSGLSSAPLFVPSVGNYYKGMITSVPLNLALLPKIPSGAEIHAAIADHFAAQTDGFVEVAPLSPLDRASELNPQALNGTNAMRLYVFANDARAQAAIIAVYDNLGKGASGAAVQNLNILLGVAPATSLAA
ncbi:N-acetyl-gamma-glutamyl-phosphate reductase [Pannonibacter carbonis]|uniref:N-acetyl-gamma-glutamyl-phosphate reductase n=1 Tax=Pannonibacter carbonis TaxID=2067569 RepID=UPI000D1081C6|nr:N-acetyl-gamma-glutamyl-phosphate reductase [Pannonibacter carbonis]